MNIRLLFLRFLCKIGRCGCEVGCMYEASRPVTEERSNAL